MTLSADDRNSRLERAISRARKLLDGDFAATAEGGSASTHPAASRRKRP
jgi:hypothetical protein